MLTPRNLLEMPITYDIIVSDFGREATIEYLRLVASAEKQLIDTILERDGLEFFDEYRRIMFTVIGDLAYFKREAILESTTRNGYLKDDILIGLVGSPSMTQEFVDRVAFSVLQETIAAVNRGHNYIRVMIPCNTLSGLSMEIARIIQSTRDLQKRVHTYGLSPLDLSKISGAQVTVHTVPEAAVRFLAGSRQSGSTQHVLVLGTRGANALYKEVAHSYAMEILPLQDWEYKLIDRAVVASIGGGNDEMHECKALIQNQVIAPRKASLGEMVVLEACTDFRFGLGLNSLDVFAQAMVAECYTARGTHSRSLSDP